MPRGGPDWGIAAPSSYAFPIVSYEDYLMRQGLVKTLDGKGDIILFDSFEQGLSKWYQSIGDANNYIELSPDHARGGNWALKFNVLNAGLSMCQAAATIPVGQPNRFGAEFNFTMRSDFYYPEWALWYYDFADFYAFRIRYDSVNRKLQYRNELDAWVNFADLTWELNPIYYFHPVKFVIDAVNLEYVKFICRGNEYDLSGRYPVPDVQTSRRAIQPRFTWNYGGGAVYPSYLDDVIVTTNEP